METAKKVQQFINNYWMGVVILAGATTAILSLVLSSGQPVWFDEGYSILLAKHSFSELLSLTAVDAHPPLYYLLLKLWGGLFGFGEVALRSLSAVLMGAAVTMAGVTLRYMFSVRVAVTALPFIIFAPFVLRYGYELRMYALATLIAISATYILLKARAAKTWKWWGVYAVLVALGMYTLYMTVAIWLAHFVWLLIVSIKTDKRPFWKWPWLYAFAGSVLLFAAYIPTFLHQLVYSALPGMGNEMTISQLANIVSTFLLYIPEWSLGGWGTLWVLAVVVVLGLFGVSLAKTLPRQKKPYFALLLLLSFVPIAFYALTSLPPRDPIYIIRYMAHSALFIYMIVGVIVAYALMGRTRTKTQQLGRIFVSLCVLFMMVGGVVVLHRTGNFNFERMQQPMTQTVRDFARCDSDRVAVVTDDPYTYIDSAFYFEDCNLLFYSKAPLEYKGGYAMLHDSDKRIASSNQLHAGVLIHLSWKGAESQFTPDSRYRFVDSSIFDKQVVSRYELIGE